MKEHGLLLSPAMASARHRGAKTQTRRPITQYNSIITGIPKNLKKQFKWEDLALVGTDAGSVLYMPPPSGAFVHAQWPWPKPAVGIASNIYLTPRIAPGHRIWWKVTWRIAAWDPESAWLLIGYPAMKDNYVEYELTEADDPDGELFNRLWIQCSDDMAKHGVEPDPSGLFTGADELPTRNRSSLLMYRWAAPYNDAVIAVRPERLLDITDADCLAEGIARISKDGGMTYRYGIANYDGWPGNDNCGWHWKDWCATPREAYLKLWDTINGPGAAAKNPWVWVYTVQHVQPTALPAPSCPICHDKGWYHVDEWIGPLQGRRDCSCGAKAQPAHK